jgi:hypothetical protein
MAAAVMNPRTHPRGAAPTFGLPKPNPNPAYMTDALWWLVCMRESLEPSDSENGGTYADKPGYHNRGSNLPDHGEGNPKTDHSIRRAPDRAGPWWKSKCSAHDWTFKSAQSGNYANIIKYTKRLVDAMRSPTDLRPDDVYAYTLGQLDGDPIVEGYNEYTNGNETSADKSHLWHRHDSFRRNIIGDFYAMWKALTIDMGWSYAEWQRSVTPQKEDDKLATSQAEFDKLMNGYVANPANGQKLADALLNAKAGSKVWPTRTLRNFVMDLWGVRDFVIGDTVGSKPENSGINTGSPIYKAYAGIAGLVDSVKALATGSKPPTS